MLRNKDSGLGANLFSLVPSGVPSYKTSQVISEESEPQPISSPDSFSDFFKVIGQSTYLKLWLLQTIVVNSLVVFILI